MPSRSDPVVKCLTRPAGHLYEHYEESNLGHDSIGLAHEPLDQGFPDTRNLLLADTGGDAVASAIVAFRL